MISTHLQEKIERMLKEGDLQGAAHVLRSCTPDKEFPLYYALEKGTPELVKAVLDSGIGIDRLEHVFHAVWSSKNEYLLDKIKLLLEYGLKVENTLDFSYSYNTILQIPKTRRADEVWDLLAPRILSAKDKLPKGWEEALLRSAAYYHRGKLLEKLSQQNFKLNTHLDDTNIGSRFIAKTLLHKMVEGFEQSLENPISKEHLDEIRLAFEVFASSGLSGNAKDTFERNVLHYLCLYEAPIEVHEVFFQVFFRESNNSRPINWWENAPLFRAFDPVYKIVNDRDAFGNTPLHYACKRGDIEVIEFLLKKGADPNVENNEGKTPLFYLNPKAVSAIKMMLDYGANPRVEDKHGKTLLDYFLDEQKIDFESPNTARLRKDSLLLLLEREPDPQKISQYMTSFLTLLIKASAPRIGSDNYPKSVLYDLVEEVIKSGANVNTPDQEGNYPIHYATIDLGLTQILLKKGADPDVRSYYDENTPAHWALERGRIEVLALLLESGANPNAKNKEGKTLTHLAVEYLPKTVEALSLLKKFGGDFSVKTPAGESLALYYVKNLLNSSSFTLYTLNADSLKELASLGLDFKDEKILFHAVQSPRTLDKQVIERRNTLLRFLVKELGVSINAKDTKGNTPLHLACREKDRELAQLLINLGAKPWERNLDGNTPGDILAFFYTSYDGRTKWPIWAMQLGIFPLNNEKALLAILENEKNVGKALKGIKRFIQGMLEEDPLASMELIPTLFSRSPLLRDITKEIVLNSKKEFSFGMGLDDLG